MKGGRKYVNMFREREPAYTCVREHVCEHDHVRDPNRVRERET